MIYNIPLVKRLVCCKLSSFLEIKNDVYFRMYLPSDVLFFIPDFHISLGTLNNLYCIKSAKCCKNRILIPFVKSENPNVALGW